MADRSPRPLRVLYVVASGMSANVLLRGQLSWMARHGFTVAVAASPGADLDAAGAREGVETLPVPIARDIAPGADLRALAALTRTMRRWQPDVVVASSPKGALVGMLAAWAARVPVRIALHWGLRVETLGGLKRRVLVATERLTARAATRVLAVSPSLAAVIERERLSGGKPVGVLASGTSNGVRAERFERSETSRAAQREALGIPLDAPVVGFVGRLTRDKGVGDLVAAFRGLRSGRPDARLLLVGGFEDGDPVDPEVRDYIVATPAVVETGFVTDPAPYYSAMDVLAFPSYREGFPNVPLEAAAAGLPVVGARATGTVDAVADGVTGRLVDVGDAEALQTALAAYLADPTLAAEHGAAGRRRVMAEYPPERVWAALAAEIERLAARPRLTP